MGVSRPWARLRTEHVAFPFFCSGMIAEPFVRRAKTRIAGEAAHDFRLLERSGPRSRDRKDSRAVRPWNRRPQDRRGGSPHSRRCKNNKPKCVQHLGLSTGNRDADAIVDLVCGFSTALRWESTSRCRRQRRLGVCLLGGVDARCE